jgi:hypothetical protein
MDFTNGAQLHLLVNHIAIVGVPVAALALAWGLVRRQPEVARVGLGLLALVAASVVLPYVTGEAAEEVVERYGVEHDAIEAHEDFATTTALATGTLALFALGALLALRRVFRRGLALVVLVAALPVAWMLARTGHLGGEIRHPEIRLDAAAGGTEEAGDPASDPAGDPAGDDRGRGRGRGRRGESLRAQP